MFLPNPPANANRSPERAVDAVVEEALEAPVARVAVAFCTKRKNALFLSQEKDLRIIRVKILTNSGPRSLGPQL